MSASQRQVPHPTHQLGKWSREGRPPTKTTRICNSRLFTLQLASSSKDTSLSFPRGAVSRGTCSAAFPLCHGSAAGLFDEQALAHSSAAGTSPCRAGWHQLLQPARTGCLPLSQCQLFGGARHQAGSSDGSVHLKSDNAGPAQGTDIRPRWPIRP